MSYQRIDTKSCQQLLQNKDVIVLDVRDKTSFILGHILGAKHIEEMPLAQFIAQVDQTLPLVVCCYHGISSQNAALYFSEQGFSEVYSLDGGYEGWLEFNQISSR